MKTKHTPGPWNKNLREDGNVQIERLNCIGVMILPGDGSEPVGFVPGGRSEECKANANLMAAAPDLLVALERARNYMKEFGCTDQLEFDKIDAAIKKATEG